MREPPSKPPIAIASFDDDYIRELGDKIAALSPPKADMLWDYLRQQGLLLK